jgi:RHS repeat-associated protein
MAPQTSTTDEQNQKSERSFQVVTPALSLSKGGGALRGIGEKFSANPVTGTGTLTVPIAVSPGRAGFGPQFTVSYDSGSGNGPFGLGWSLSCPSITRRTDRGLPQFQDAIESDIFILSGAEDLVPALIQDATGQWTRDITQRNGYTITRYRPRVEGLFSRIERWTRVSDGDTYWRSISKDNITTFYGATTTSRVADPSDATRIFTWLISQSQDDKGNVIVYEYVAEDSSNVNFAQANERNRTAASRSANCYLKRIKYGNLPSLLTQPDLSKLRWLFEVVFDFDEGHYSEQPPDAQGRIFATASINPTQSWTGRVDPFSRYSACFEVRTYRLCRRVLMFHHFSNELGTQDCLVRMTEFSYEENPIASFMASVTQSGFVRQGDGTYLKRSLPSVEFDYSQAEVQQEVKEVDPASLDNLPGALDGPGYQWLDLDGEGLQSVLSQQDEGWYYKRNLSPLTYDFINGQPEASAAFEPLTEVRKLPGFAEARSQRRQFLDLAGDGQLDCVILQKPVAGFYKRTEDGDWEPFKPFASAPNLDWNDPNLRFIDLDGDGHADVLITENQAFTWFPSLAEDGFGAPIRVLKSQDEEEGPAIVFADPTKSIFLADMSGDGLTDIVRIRNGEVCYWPNMGYGRFGRKVAMDRAPLFDSQDQFDPRRIRLADVDGSGVTDFIYTCPAGVRIYFNQAGNSWSDPETIPNFPFVDDVSKIQALDLLGNGTACLVWTSSLPGEYRHSMRYIDLMGGQKPYLLIHSSNNLGAETRIYYAPSTKFYLTDREAGQPWATRLPFPVQVVERVETYDWISRNLFVTRYTYHHGYYDGIEREFRGFGMVEQLDTEDLGALSTAGSFPDGTNIDAASYAPPVLTKTWFHTGAYPTWPQVSRIFEEEYYRESDLPQGVTGVTGLTDAQFETMLLPDTLLSSGLNGDEIREGIRSLKGSMLRQEIYAQDGTLESDQPYSVSESNFTVRELQPFAGNRHAVFFTHAREAIDFHYDRQLYNVGTPVRMLADPRVTHSMVLAVDDYGNELQSVTIAYGRRHDAPDSLLTDGDRAIQRALHATYTESTHTNPVLEDDVYRTRLPAEVRTFELIKVTPDASLPDITNLFGFNEMTGKVTAASDGQHDLPFEDIYAAGATQSHPYRRLIEQVRTIYRSDDLGSCLPLGSLQSLALPCQQYKLAFTSGLIAQVYQRGGVSLLPSPGNVLGAGGADGGGYVDLATDGHWWVPSGRVFYSSNPADIPAKELAAAQANFFLPCRFSDPFGNNSTVLYDSYDLLVLETEDALQQRSPAGTKLSNGNKVTAGERAPDGTIANRNDYHVLQPALLTDPNGNRSQVAIDGLGMVAGTAVSKTASTSLGSAATSGATTITLASSPTGLMPGHQITFVDSSSEVAEVSAAYAVGSTTVPLANALANAHSSGTAVQWSLGDSLDGFLADLVQQDVDAFFANPTGPPATNLLVNATSRVVYDLGRNARFTTAPMPVFAATIARETHVSDLGPNQNSKLHVSLSFSDGYGREIQKKMHAEAGPVVDGGPVIDPRWVGSGWTIFNNKGKPVRQYEPFFSSTNDFEFAFIVGVSPILLYDPLGRVVATVHPDYSEKNAGTDSGELQSHSWEKVVFDPWRQASWDRNDTVLIADPATDADVGAYFGRLPAADYLPTWYSVSTGSSSTPDQQDAAQKASLCKETPTSAFFDTLGRTFLTVAFNRTPVPGAPPVDEHDRTFLEIDIQNNQRSVTDALSRKVMTYDYDMLGNKIHQSSVDAGERWMLTDVSGKPLLTWDSMSHRVRHEYDSLRRPTNLYLQTGMNPEIVAERIVYGENQPNDQTLNLRTRVYQQFDSASWVTNNKYDFSGNLLSSTRALLQDYKNQVDWSKSPEFEAGNVFTTSTTYNALNRPTSVTTPDNSVLTPSYNERTLLLKVAANIGGSTSITQFVNNITYDPKGQRQSIDYGCGASTAYKYDSNTFRLTSLITTRTTDNSDLQNLQYWYDPIGNITRIDDSAQQKTYFSNQVVTASADYTYDALYRLMRATGREHIGQLSVPWATWDDGPRMNQPQPNPNDPVVMRIYAEKYSYDAVGNILAVVHLPTNGSSTPANGNWTRTYNYDEPSVPYKTNRLTSTKVGTLTETYQYNANGDMIQMPQLTVMNWDFKDQLQATSQQSVASGTPQTTYYVYDSSGQRVRKVTDAAAASGVTPIRTKERIYLGGFEIYREYGADGTTPQLERQSLQIMDDNQRVATVETKTIDQEKPVTSPISLTRYQFDNHLGSACLELNDKADIISYEEYYPYGSTSYQAVDTSIKVSAKRYRYTGKERDDETGFYYHVARYYAPWLGRWLSSDPRGLVDGTNVYVYGSNSPSIYVDPTGTQCVQSCIDPTTPTSREEAAQESLPENERHLTSSQGSGNGSGALSRFWALLTKPISEDAAQSLKFHSELTDALYEQARASNSFRDWMVFSSTQETDIEMQATPNSALEFILLAGTTVASVKGQAAGESALAEGETGPNTKALEPAPGDAPIMQLKASVQGSGELQKMPIVETRTTPQFVPPPDLSELQPIVARARADLANDPALLRSVLSPREFALVNNPKVGAMFRGTAVQRLATLRISSNPIRNARYFSPSEYVGPGPGYLRFRGNQPGPDLFGIGNLTLKPSAAGWSTQAVEITTPAAVPGHLARPEYQLRQPVVIIYPPF